VPFEAQVIAAYGRHVKVRDSAGRVLDARPFGRRVQPICGDLVRCEDDRTHDEIHVLEILPRRSVLARSTLRGGGEPVAANLTLLVTVLAPLPKPDPFIIDRYLCAASSAGLGALVVLNKAELVEEALLGTVVESFAAAGYPTLFCSAQTSRGLDQLAGHLGGHTSVFVGQSGVGKSSLIRELIPGSALATGELDGEAEGRHTTTHSSLHDLPGGGALIDSPGVRDFAPAIESLEPRSLGFPEVDRLATQCRFLDCQHSREPGCAVREAAETGGFDARRYESYRRLRRLREELELAKGPARRNK
jgi:ribosome biogenesis GTPase